MQVLPDPQLPSLGLRQRCPLRILLCKSRPPVVSRNLGSRLTSPPLIQAEGREADENETETTSHPATHVPRMTTREICVPRVSEGTLQYTLMEFVESGQGNYWAVRYKMPPPHLHHHHQQQQQQQQQQPMTLSTSMVTSDTPRSVMGVAGPGQLGWNHQMGQMMAVGY